MPDRRQFLLTGLGAVAAAALNPPAHAEAPNAPPLGRIAIDALVPDGPHFDPAPAIAAGLTCCVLDMAMYPRGFDEAVRALAEWSWTFRRPDSPLIKVLTAADVERAKRERKLAIVLACQDASILGPSTGSVAPTNLQNLNLFFDLGLRVLQLTHNEQNALGASFREKRDSGLSRLGESVVGEMNRLGMLIDLSHCGSQTTLQAIELSAKPCAITHAGCRALHPSARNKNDDEIRAVAEKGGFFGVYNMTLWMTDAPTASIETVLDHIDHAVKIAGVEHVGFGSDHSVLAGDDPAETLAGMRGYAQRNLGLPGAEKIPNHVFAAELNGPDRLARLADGLARRGYKENEIDGIVGGNFLRVLREVVG